MSPRDGTLPCPPSGRGGMWGCARPCCKEKMTAAQRGNEQPCSLCADLPTDMRDKLLSLWVEYEEGATIEASLVRGMDKLETLMQHDQGKSPPEFDYTFNLRYARKSTGVNPLLMALRERIEYNETGQDSRRPASPDLKKLSLPLLKSYAIPECCAGGFLLITKLFPRQWNSMLLIHAQCTASQSISIRSNPLWSKAIHSSLGVRLFHLAKPKAK